MTFEETKQLIARAVVAYPFSQKTDLTNTIQVWAELLADISYPLANAALARHITTKNYFPTIAEIRSAVAEMSGVNSELPSAEDAWKEVMKKLDYYSRPKYSHPLIQQAVDCIGYISLCNSENPVADRAHFYRAYNNYRDRVLNDNINNSVAQITGYQHKGLPNFEMKKLV